ncbi:hypothetical protein [Chitinophaga solisilvae]|uniref:hypothetical protein n=1 Tax=Chitinophaga solisilvae TaxID=1233460 RepID=UPI00136AFB12|nr:hypothetical protein [Chitinophaga solisilvae]
MRATTAILQKIFTRQFYVQNTGFFLVLFYLLFGVVNSSSLISYHYSLMLGFLGNKGFLLLVLLLWTAYLLKCTGFVLKVMQTQGYEFLYATMGSMEKKKRRKIWFLIHTGIYMPVLIYAAIAASVAVQKGWMLSAGIVIVFNVAMCVWPLALYERKLAQPDVLFFTGQLQRWINRHFTKPPVLFFLYELLTQFPRRLFSTKLFSAAVLWITFYLMRSGEYFELRGLEIGVMLSVLLHLQIILHHRAFDDTWLNFMDNLPISMFRHYSRLMGVYAILYLPEIIMIAVNARTLATAAGLVMVFALAFSLLVLFRCLLFYPKINPEIQVRYVLLISFVVLFMVLGRYEWPAIILLQIAAAVIFFRKYRSYEPYIE